VKEQHLVFLKKRNNEKFTPSYSSFLPKDTATPLAKFSKLQSFFFKFRLNIIIEPAFIDVSMDGEKTFLQFYCVSITPLIFC